MNKIEKTPLNKFCNFFNCFSHIFKTIIIFSLFLWSCTPKPSKIIPPQNEYNDHNSTNSYVKPLYGIPITPDSSCEFVRTKDEIMVAVFENISKLRNIYNSHLIKSHFASGKVTIKFQIDENGNVPYVSVVESELQQTTMEFKILEQIATWKFTPSDKKCHVCTEVIYPFNFNN